jgi:membrane protease subunit HflK
VTRERLYLDTIESVLGKTNTLMLDVKGGNNVIYLPIDRLHRTAVPTDTVKEAESLQAPQDILDNAAKSTRATIRGREARGQ